MSDETSQGTTEVAAPPVATEPAAIHPEVAAAQAKLEAAQAELSSYKQTLAAIQGQVQGGGQPQAVQAGNYQIPRQIVDEFTRSGMTEKDAIDAAKVLMPFINTFGGPLAQQQMHMQRETEFMRAASNKKEFPKWDILADTIDTLRNQAAQRGLVLAPKDAYEWAMGAAYDKVRAVDEASTAASARAQDATSHGLFAPSAHTRINFDDKVITSAADIAKLSDAEADTLFDKLGNTPF